MLLFAALPVVAQDDGDGNGDTGSEDESPIVQLPPFVVVASSEGSDENPFGIIMTMNYENGEFGGFTVTLYEKGTQPQDPPPDQPPEDPGRLIISDPFPVADQLVQSVNRLDGNGNQVDAWYQVVGTDGGFYYANEGSPGWQVIYPGDTSFSPSGPPPPGPLPISPPEG